MIFKAKANNKSPAAPPPVATPKESVEDWLSHRGVSADTFGIAPPAADPIGEFNDRHNLTEDSFKTVEGRKGAALRHRLTARMLVLCTLIAPMVVIPFWLMWILSPGNVDRYEKDMQRSLLAALATNVLGLCWVITRDLFPQGGGEGLGESDDGEPLE